MSSKFGGRHIGTTPCCLQGHIHGITNAYTPEANKSTGNVSHSCPTLRNIIPNWRLLVSVLQGVLVTRLTQGSSNLYGRMHLGLTYFLVWVRKFYNAEGQMSACRKLLAMQMILV